MINKNFGKKKVIIAAYYPANKEVNIINFLKKISKKKFKILLPVIKPSQAMCFKYWNFKDPLYVEGHFESEKYFIDCFLEIKSEFKFKNEKSFTNCQIFKDIKNSNSVSICVRQNRFSERKRLITKDDERNSLTFTKDQIQYIKKSIDLIKSKVPNPKFFLWSNDHKNLKNYFPGYEYTSVSTGKIDLDLFLMTQSKHFIVIPSSYNWWGAWLRNNKDSIILRPSDLHFSNFRLNNKDFWPDSWTKV